jgi:hypothetical protein
MEDSARSIPGPAQFKILLKEAREKSRLCELIASYFEDVASSEEVFGKALVKVSLFSPT